MRAVIIGLGNQGAKRLAVAGNDVVATVDPVAPNAHHKTIHDVPLDSFDAGLVCAPDSEKLAILNYLLQHGKHVMVEKPLTASNNRSLSHTEESAKTTGAVVYTAYNHRFEPNIIRLKETLDSEVLGTVYSARLFYGNGTALDIKESVWRDEGLGVLGDLGSHLLDLALFLFGSSKAEFELWGANRFETRSLDHVSFGSKGSPFLQLEATYLSWRNTFTVDVFGSLGSAHIDCLCKWGPSTFTIRERKFPSGVPQEQVHIAEGPDPTWILEYQYFKQLCQTGGTNIQNDQLINAILNDLSEALLERSDA